MTDDASNPNVPEPERPGGSTPRRAPSSADVHPRRPDYRGEELDPERGPGLGCFWFQVIVLGFFIILIPIGLNLDWPFELLAILLFVVIGLLLLTGQTVIFLLRLVAADRRAQGRRRPVASATKTVGEIEDAMQSSTAGPPAEAGPSAGPAPSGADEAMPAAKARTRRRRATADAPSGQLELPSDPPPEPPSAAPSAAPARPPRTDPEEPDPGVRQ